MWYRFCGGRLFQKPTLGPVSNRLLDKAGIRRS
jgi:hypothetical protein